MIADPLPPRPVLSHNLMKILEHLISTLDMDAPVRDIRQGIFHTGVLTRCCGLAATLPRDALRQDLPLVKEPGLLMDKSARDLVQMAFSESILEAALGMAALNSVLDIDEDACEELNARDLMLQKGENKRVVVVGHFPFIPEVRKAVRELWVIEKNPREGDLEEREAYRLIPQADLVALTGTSLTNHSLETLLELCDPKAYVIMLGDTVPLSPVLFDYGVDALSGTKVVEADLALRCISQGANFRQIMGTRRLTLMKP